MSNITDLKVGQLVWYDTSLGGEKWDKGKNLDQGKVCNRIIAIDPGLDNNCCTIEMLYLEKNGKRELQYLNHKQELCKTGDKKVVNFTNFEKHVSPSTSNIWWKIR